MARVSCLSVTLAFVAVYASYLVYIYFVQHQPNAALLAAIKSKSTQQFQQALASTLNPTSSTSSHHPPPLLHGLHFGNGRTVPAAIAMHGTTDMLRHWHALGGDVSTPSTADGRTPLHIAATFNTPAFLSHLLTLLPPTAIHTRADNSYTPLLYAVLFSQHNNTRTLLAHAPMQADPNDRLAIGARYSACQLAAIYSDEAMMDALVEAGGLVERGEGYYDDWLRAWTRVQARREQQQMEQMEQEHGQGQAGDGREEAEEEERIAGQARLEGVPVEVDGEVVWVGDEGQRSKAQYWSQKQRIAKGEDPYTVFRS